MITSVYDEYLKRKLKELKLSFDEPTYRVFALIDFSIKMLETGERIVVADMPCLKKVVQALSDSLTAAPSDREYWSITNSRVHGYEVFAETAEYKLGDTRPAFGLIAGPNTSTEILQLLIRNCDPEFVALYSRSPNIMDRHDVTVNAGVSKTVFWSDFRPRRFWDRRGYDVMSVNIRRHI